MAERHIMTDAMRGRLDRYLDEAAHSLDRWPLGAVDADTIADALTMSYRRARRRIPDRWADAECLHALRRRAVEHRHQIDLAAHVWPSLDERRAAKAQRLRSRLGVCQHMVVLAQFAAARQPLAQWRTQLTPAIAARRRAHLKTAAARRTVRRQAESLPSEDRSLSTDNTPRHTAARRKRAISRNRMRRNII